MVTFEITIQRKTEDGWPVVVQQTQSGSFLPVRTEGILTITPEALIEHHDDKSYGTILGKALFKDEVRDAFVRAQTVGRDASDPYLRVLLSVEAEDLKSLHWGHLCAPFEGKWDFLSLQQQTPFSLYLPSLTDRRFPPIGRRDLRALVLVAGPSDLNGDYGLGEFDIAKNVSNIRKAMGEIPCDILVADENPLNAPTLDNLCEHITAEKYTLLHIICHGKVMQDGETVLFFPENKDGKPVTGTKFIERLNRLTTAQGLPHLTFLGSCETADPEAENGLGGLGQRLVRDLGMPAVVAMTDSITVDTAEVFSAAFYTRLREHGEADRAIAEALTSLQGKYDVTVPALFSRLGGRALFSDSLERDLTAKEIEYGLSKLAEFLPGRAPVLQNNFETISHRLLATLGDDVTALSEANRNELTEALADINSLSVEVLDLSFNALSLGQEPPAYDSRSPFRGLESFRPEDHEFFFGRETLTSRLAQKLNEHPFLAVLGASGSGKSSLVMAGLIPAIGKDYVIFKPGENPVNALEKALLSNSSVQLLVVDQFEELFTLTQSDTQRQEFISHLLEHTNKRHVVVTMRADFLGEAAAYRSLRDEIESHQAIVPPMDAAELRRAMEGQAGRVGLRFESDLSQQMLDDVMGEPGAMPLLQHALWMLWKRRHGRWLRAEEYRAFGGVRQAIASTAEDVFAQISEFEQERVRDIFLRLTRLDDDTSTGEHRDTRRRVLVQDLIPAGSDPAATSLLVKRLADARLVVVNQDEVEVAHEALIRHWERLKNWLNEDRDNLRLREDVTENARQWENADRDESLLNHRGARLELALAMSNNPRYRLNPTEQAYLDACEELREREIVAISKRRRLTITGVSIALVIIMAILAGWGWTSSQNSQALANQAATAESARATAVNSEELARQAEDVAVQAQADAEEQAFNARVGELAAQAVALREKQPILSLLMGIEAFNLQDNLRTRSALLDNLNLNPQVRKYLSGHTDTVVGVAFSPDGNVLASGSYDGTLILWDVQSGKPIGEPLRGHTGFIRGIAFSPDGKLLASGGDDQTVILWDVATHQPVGQPLQAHTNTVYSVAFSPDGETLAAGSFDNTISLWDVATRQLIGQPLSAHTDSVYSVTFSPDGNMLASGSIDKTVILWNLQSGQPIGQPLSEHTDTVKSVAFNPDGSLLASGSSDGTIILWNVQNRQPIGQPLRRHTDEVRSLAFSPNGQTLASASYDDTIILWDITNPNEPRQQATFTGHSDDIKSVAFGPDNQTLASGSEDHTIILWDVNPHLPNGETINEASSNALSLAFGPDGRMFAFGMNDGSVLLGDARNGQITWRTLTGHTDRVYSLAFSQDGRYLASGSVDDSVILWDVESGQQVGQPLTGHATSVVSLAFSPDGKLLASGSVDRTVRLWDVASGKSLGEPLQGHSDSIWCLAFSPDSRILASGSYDNSIILWNVETRKLMVPLDGHSGRVTSLAFSPDGLTLASGSTDNTIIFWDLSAFESDPPFGTVLKGHANTVNSLAFSPDGKTLASGSLDQTIILWDVQSRQPIGEPLQGHFAPVAGLVFDPNNKGMMSGSLDQKVILWDLDPNSWVDLTCQRAGRNLTDDEWLEYLSSDVGYLGTCPE